jgi:hypothetical protein
VEAGESRKDALAKGRTLADSLPEAAVRVRKEIFCEDTNQFQSVAVFERNTENFDDDDRADRKGELPCRTPSDLVTPHARDTIARVIEDWLARNQVSPLELLHRVDLVERFEATEGEFQHAVQKVAIAQASESDASVQDFIKQINALIQKTVDEMDAEERKNPFAPVKPADLAAFVADMGASEGRERRLRGAVAASIAHADGWAEKLERVLALAEAADTLGEEAQWTVPVFDEYLAEFAAVDAARRSLFEDAEDLGDELDALTDLFAGGKCPRGRLRAAGRRLAGFFAAKRFAAARLVVGRRILEGLKSPKRMKPHDFDLEVELSRSVADRLIAAGAAVLGVDDISEAFIARSARFLDNEVIGEFVATEKTPVDALLKLIDLEDNLVGEHNKRKLGSYVRARLGAHKTVSWFETDGGAGLKRLSELAAGRAAIDEAGFDAKDKRELGAHIDAIALKIEGQEKILDRIAARKMPPVDAALAYLRLVAKRALPAGELAERAIARAGRALSSSEAQAAMAADDEISRAKAKEVGELMAALGGAGSKAA